MYFIMLTFVFSLAYYNLSMTLNSRGWLLRNVILWVAYLCTNKKNSFLFHLSLLNFGSLVLDSGQRERMDRRDMYVCMTFVTRTERHAVFHFPSNEPLWLLLVVFGLNIWLLCICCVLVHDVGCRDIHNYIAQKFLIKGVKVLNLLQNKQDKISSTFVVLFNASLFWK